MRTVQSLALLSAITISAFGQSGGFKNLDLESAQVSQLSPGFYADTSRALPYWAVGGTEVGGSEVKYFSYDSRTFDAWGVSVLDSKQTDVFPPFSGQFSVLLLSGRIPDTQHFGNIIYGSASISQTATVPAGANSLLFSASQLFGPVELSMQNQSLPYYKMEDRGAYSVYGADISAFAGQMSELKFRTPWPSSVYLDDIQFSGQVIPEPTTISLIASGLGLSLVCFRAKRTQTEIFPAASRV